MTPAALSETTWILVFALLLLAPLAVFGLALMNTGLGRSRSAAQSLLGSVLLVAVAVLVFVAFGASLAGGPGGHLSFGGQSWDVIGHAPAFSIAYGLNTLGRAPLITLLQLWSVAIMVLIPWGSGSDRWRTVAAMAATVFCAGIIFPLIAHWTGSGWLAQLGTNFGLAQGFADSSNAAATHVLGGVTALVVIWVAGPRKGKFPKHGVSTAIPGHQSVYVLLGCGLALVGWLGLNSAAALLAPGATLPAAVGAAVNTVLAASAAVLATFFITRARFGKPDASLCANGWIAGLVTSSATAALVGPGAAIFIGCVAGVITPLLVELLELGLSIDDPSGAIAVHGVAGVWGLLATGFFARLAPTADRGAQILAQLVGIVVLLGLLFPLLYLLYLGLNKVVRFRADSEGERMGMDLAELGGSAYPEFVIHRDEFHR